jgi:dethiobiotin synthetase
VTVALLDALRSQGLAVSGMKPVAAGVGPDGQNDDVARLAAAGSPAEPPAPEDLNPYCFPRPVSPHLEARRTGVAIEPARIIEAYGRLARRKDAVLVEGAGGWFAPIGERSSMADLAVALGLPVLLVVGLRLGCLNHALLTRAAVRAAGLALAGWVGSVVDPTMPALEENVATLASHLPGPWALLPHALARDQDAAHLAELATQLATVQFSSA